MKSSVFGLPDVLATIKAQKLSRRLMEYLLTFSAEGLTDFQVPVYFIHGSKDYQVLVTLVEEYLESITAPDKDLFLIPNAGHIINIDNPSAVISATHDIFNRYINKV